MQDRQTGAQAFQFQILRRSYRQSTRGTTCSIWFLIMTHFLLKAPARSARTSSDSGTSWTNYEIFNVSTEFAPALNKLHQHAAQFVLTALKATTLLCWRIIFLWNDFSLEAVDITTALGCRYQQQCAAALDLRARGASAVTCPLKHYSASGSELDLIPVGPTLPPNVTIPSHYGIYFCVPFMAEPTMPKRGFKKGLLCYHN